MTYTKYIIGFLLSLGLTLLAYAIVVLDLLSAWAVGVLLVLAVAQMIVQLVYFLHLGEEVGPRLKLLSFVFMEVILLIIVVGSLWIMNHLNYNMMEMSPDEKETYMMGQKDKGY